MKLQIKLLYLLILVMVSLHKNSTAQTIPNSYKIVGIVADSITKKPLDYITMSLKTSNETTIKVTLTKANGSFEFSNLQPLKYKLTLVAIGHQNKSLNIDLTNNAKMISNLDTIFMAAKLNKLKEVTVTTDHPIIKQQADRITYDLQADPESKGSNVLTMMRKVPFVSVDANDNILLKGNGSFKVLINGKPSGMVESNLKAVLQSMPASTIQSIEVITNPPAKYDAEGMAGIINIITNKKIDNGYKGTVNFNENFPVGGPGIGTSFSVKQGKFGISGYGGASTYSSPLTQYANNRTTFASDATSLVQNGTVQSKSRNGYFGTEISYEIDSLHLLSGQFSINGNHLDGYSYQTSILRKAANLQRYDLGNSNNGGSGGIDASINYQLGFKADKNRLLTFSYRYLNYGNNQHSNLIITNIINYIQPDYRQDNNTQTSEQTFQIDYVHPVKMLNIEAGIKGILRNNTSDYQYLLYHPSSGLFEPYPDFSDQFNYRQNVFSAYNSYRYSIKSWSFSAGVRAEQTVVDADFISTASTVKQHVFNLIPTLSVNKEFKDRSSLSFGFNQRIKRPNIRRLNPFVDRSNPDFVSSGNPNLQNVLVNNLQLSYSKSKKLSVTVALGYSFIGNIDLRTSAFDTAANITRTTYQNTGKADRSGLDFNISYPINKNWNMSVNGNVAYFKLSGLVSNTIIENKLLTSNISASSGYKFNQRWRLNASLTFISRNPTDLQGTSNGFVRSLFSCNKELVKNKLSFAASVNNPFSKHRNNLTETKGPDFTQVGISQDYFRSFGLSLNYNFGKLKQDIKKNKRGINNDDVSR